MRLWFAIRFPHLSLSALDVYDHNPSLFITDKQAVFYATESAIKKGVALGMDITTAQLLGECEPLKRNQKKEQRLLQGLKKNCYQFTPYIEEYQAGHEYGLLLEVSQCLKLFGGSKHLHERLIEFITSQQHTVAYGLAHTAAGAWLLSYQSHPINGQENRTLFLARLNQVSLDTLYEHKDSVKQLKNAGFRRLGDIAKQIKNAHLHSLTRRLKPEFIQTIQSIFDIDSDFEQATLFQRPRPLYEPESFFKETIEFDYPVAQADQLKPAVEDLLKQLEHYLVQRQRECQHIQWRLKNIYKEQESLEVHCDYPQSRGHLFYDLTCIKLDNQALPFEVDSLTLICKRYTTIESRAQALNLDNTKTTQASHENFGLTALKLRMYLGENAVFKVHYEDNHVPETSNGTLPLSEKANQSLPSLQQRAIRPTWLFHSPKAISVSNRGLYWHGVLTLLSKPERIETRWWNQTVARDYYLAERQDHLRLWVFLDLPMKKWYVQGIFA